MHNKIQIIGINKDNLESSRGPDCINMLYCYSQTFYKFPGLVLSSNNVQSSQPLVVQKPDAEIQMKKRLLKAIVLPRFFIWIPLPPTVVYKVWV